MDPRDRAMRRQTAHRKRAEAHPLWELYGRTVVRSAVVVGAGLLLGFVLIPAAYAWVKVRADEALLVMAIVGGVAVLFGLLRWFFDPLRRHY